MQIDNDVRKTKPVAMATIGGLIVAGLVLAGCGGGSKLASGAGSSAVAKGQSAASSSGSSAAAGSSPSSTPSAVSGNSNSSFCVEAIAEQAQEAKNADAFTTDSPTDLQKFEEQEQAELKVFVSKAPSQIKSSVQVIAAADDKLVAALKAANYDFTKIDPTLAASFDTPEFDAAVTQVDDYLEKVCGIKPSDDSSS